MTGATGPAALALALALALPAPAWAAPGSVPVTRLWSSVVPIGLNDLKPPECASVPVTNLVVGTGTVGGTSASDLILGGPGADTLKGFGENDCLVGGDGNDTLDGGAAPADVCLGGPGTNSATGCEATVSTGLTRHLKTDGPGDRPSTPVLPIDAGAPTVAALPNYDTDRDVFAGLVVAEGTTSDNPNETDGTKHQTWSEPQPADLPLAGPAELRVWSAMRNLQTSKRGRVRAYLQDCPPSGACDTFKSASLSVADWSGGSTTWVATVIGFGSVSRTVPAGHSLRVKMVVDGDADDSMWFAYDTTAYPSVLTIG